MTYPKNQKPPVREVSGLARLSADPLAVLALLLATCTRAAIAVLNVIALCAPSFVVVDVPARLNRVPRRCFHWYELIVRPLIQLYQTNGI